MPPMTEPEVPIQTWVADRGTAWSAAWALTCLELTQPKFLLFAGGVVVGLPAFLAAAAHDGPVFGLVLGLALAVFLLAGCVLIAAWRRARHFRLVLPAGHRVSCRFGPDHFVMRDADAESTVQFRRYDRIDVVGDWVFLRQHARRVRVLYPRALIPPHDLSRLRLTILGRARDGQ
jgi:hypothetical protein